MKKAIGILALWAAAWTVAAVEFQWQHNGLDAFGGDIENTEIAFQIEYSVSGGPPQYIDVPEGSLPEADTAVTYTDNDLVILCQQPIVARVRALWRGNYSPWSAQAREVAADCPPPSQPDNMVLILP